MTDERARTLAAIEEDKAARRERELFRSQSATIVDGQAVRAASPGAADA